MAQKGRMHKLCNNKVPVCKSYPQGMPKRGTSLLMETAIMYQGTLTKITLEDETGPYC